tara:strand:- start:369 stop:611 length:243 start_codon:yes stop_codon:yes gene_type:complete
MASENSVCDGEAWKALQAHHDNVMSKVHMRQLFEEDNARFDKFSFNFLDDKFFLDYSKNIITDVSKSEEQSNSYFIFTSQ